MKILVTGTAGFIGFHTVEKLVAQGHEVLGLDNLNNYYHISLKLGRLAVSGVREEDIQYSKIVKSVKHKNYSFTELKLEDKENLNKIFNEFKPEVVINLAAQAGVRYSLEKPETYISSNITGFFNILECCRHYKVKHLTYASSSSVYGLNGNNIFSTCDNTDHPISLYAATKKSNEIMAHSYSHLFGIPTSGLRFFTVYGPWGRPDMALFIFTKSIIEGKPINVFNNGEMYRDFTYVDDIVEGIIKVTENPPLANPAWDATNPTPFSSSAPWKVYNIGNSKPVKLLDFIEIIEAEIGIKAIKNFMPLQPGDVVSTYADVTPLINELGYKPDTPIAYGVQQFVKWFRKFYKL